MINNTELAESTAKRERMDRLQAEFPGLPLKTVSGPDARAEIERYNRRGRRDPQSSNEQLNGS